MTKLFDSIGRAFTSMGAVIFVMTMVIASMIFFSHTLFLEVFPDSMNMWEKKVATWSLALGWELTVLITTCNLPPEKKWVPLLMAIASGVIVLFFIQAFDQSLDSLQITQRWFVGVLVAVINYIYADLFYTKWKERNELLEAPKRLQQAEAEVQQLRADLQHARAGREHDAAAMQQLRADLKELAAFRTKVEKELTCPHCEKPQPSYGTLRSHQGHCKEKNKMVLNGVHTG